MSQSLRSFLYGNLSGVISFLGLILFFESGMEAMLSLTLIGLVAAWLFIPVRHRELVFIDNMKGASNDITLFGWLIALIICIGLALKLAA